MTHPDLDSLVHLGQSAGANVTATIIHVAACSECLDTLAALESLAEVAHGVEPDRDFEARVLSSLAARRVTDPAPAATQPVAISGRLRDVRTRIGVSSAFVFVLASVCAWLLALLARLGTSGMRAPSLPPSSTVLLALVAGCIAVWYASRDSHSIVPMPRHS